jgi:hypothetical protein
VWRLELGLGIIGVRCGLNSPGDRPRHAGQGNQAARGGESDSAGESERDTREVGDDRRAPPVSLSGAGVGGSRLAGAVCWAGWAARRGAGLGRGEEKRKRPAWRGELLPLLAGLEGKIQG